MKTETKSAIKLNPLWEKKGNVILMKDEPWHEIMDMQIGFPKPTKRKKTKKALPKVKKTTLGKEKAKAWKAFSMWVRTHNAVDGLNICYTCGKIFPVKELQAGHFIEGRTNSVLFEEDIVECQCQKCNIWDKGNLTVFTFKKIKELGEDRINELIQLKHQTKKYTIADYQEIAEKYTKLLDAIKL